MLKNQDTEIRADTVLQKPVKENTSCIEKYPLFSNYVEAKIFEMKNENSLIRITPQYLNFTFNIETLEVKSNMSAFSIQNISSHSVKIVVLPPQTKYFVFSHAPMNWLAPGLQVVVNVTFHPVLHRPYYDWLRVCCNEGSNLMVPLKSLPLHINSAIIPDKINFGCVPIGKTVKYIMTLQPVENIVLKFFFIVIADASDCKIFPSQGRVEDAPVEIEISYCPTRYITASIPIQLYLPPIIMTPHYFTVEAVTKPTKTSEKLSTIERETERKETPVVKYEKLPSLNDKKVHALKFYKPLKKVESTPKKLTQHDVNILLMRKEKLERDPEEQLGPYGIYMDECQTFKDNAFKKFQKIVNDLRVEDKVARITDSKERIFEIDCSDELRKEITNENLAAREEYMAALNPVNNSTDVIYTRQRIIRRYDKQAEWNKSDIAENDLWQFRYQKVWRLLQLTRIILVTKRMLKILEIFKSLTPEKIQELEQEDMENE